MSVIRPQECIVHSFTLSIIAGGFVDPRLPHIDFCKLCLGLKLDHLWFSFCSLKMFIPSSTISFFVPGSNLQLFKTLDRTSKCLTSSHPNTPSQLRGIYTHACNSDVLYQTTKYTCLRCAANINTHTHTHTHLVFHLPNLPLEQKGRSRMSKEGVECQ